jgi:hypothetical protein
MPEMTAIAERLAEAERLVLQLPCRCINLGDGEYVECDRCRFLHFPEFTQGAAADSAVACQHDLLQPSPTIDVTANGKGGTCRVCNESWSLSP